MEEKQQGISFFRLNMQMIFDDLETHYPNLQFYKDRDPGRLTSVRLYHGQKDLKENLVYIAESSSLPSAALQDDGLLLSFILIGEPPDSFIHENLCAIMLPDACDPVEVLDFIQANFDYNAGWNERLQAALNNDEGVSGLCRASADYFHNPLFVHDAQFFIIACPRHVPGMLNWDVDERTGMHMVPLSTINDFKVDQEYVSTLTTKGAQIFSENQRGYPILYVNIWDDFERYGGRLCVDGLESPLKPGQGLAAEHLVSLIRVAMRRRNFSPQNHSRPFEAVFIDILNRKLTQPLEITNKINLLGWELGDKYACFVIGTEKRSMDKLAGISICNYVEAQTAGSYAFLFQGNILVLVNLTVNGGSTSDCLNQMAYIIREGLFKVGISNTYTDFSLTSYFYTQALAALEYGGKTESMLWYHRFGEFALTYIIDKACQEIPAKLVCSELLEQLKGYDNKNETELYKTLQVYLTNERNAMKTARDLFIHRSTLFYRLDRIKELFRVDLDEPTTRLYLLLSFYIMDSRK